MSFNRGGVHPGAAPWPSLPTEPTAAFCTRVTATSAARPYPRGRVEPVGNVCVHGDPVQSRGAVLMFCVFGF